VPVPLLPSSVTVTVMVYLPLGCPVGLSRYWWLALNVSTLASSCKMVSAEPSPQLRSTVCMSSVPGSVKDRSRFVLPFSLIVPGLDLSTTLAGATLFTVTVVLPLPLAPWLLVMVALTGYCSVARPVVQVLVLAAENCSPLRPGKGWSWPRQGPSR